MDMELSLAELDGQDCTALAPRRLMGSIGSLVFGNPTIGSIAMNVSGSGNQLNATHNVNVIVLSLL